MAQPQERTGDKQQPRHATRGARRGLRLQPRAHLADLLLVHHQVLRARRRMLLHPQLPAFAKVANVARQRVKGHTNSIPLKRLPQSERKGAAGSDKQHASPLQAARAPPRAAGAGAARPGAPGAAFAGDWDACRGSGPSLCWSQGWELCSGLLCLSSSAGCDRQSCSCPLRSGAACQSPRSFRLATLHKDPVVLPCRSRAMQHSLQQWLCQPGSNGAVHWCGVCSLAAVRRPRHRSLAQ